MQMCHCGKPLHYSDPAIQETIQRLIDNLGECVDVTVEDETYEVPRHYIALHGVKAMELPELAIQLGFKVKERQDGRKS